MVQGIHTYSLLIIASPDAWSLIKQAALEAFESEQSWSFTYCAPEEAVQHLKELEIKDGGMPLAICFVGKQEHTHSVMSLLEANSRYPPGAVVYKESLDPSPTTPKLHGLFYEDAEVPSKATLLFLAAQGVNIERMQTALKRQQFISVCKAARYYSHEIRNPLTNIDISAGELADENDFANSSSATFIHYIKKNSARINSLLSGVLEYTHAEDIHKEKVELSSLIESALTDFLGAYPKINIVNSIVENLRLEADHVKLAFAIYCLLSNSAEASGGKGSIEISAAVREGFIQICIQDRGEGITAAVAPFIFEPFFTTKSKSAGLGLSTAQDIINRHKGTIGFTSVKGLTQFFIRVPFASYDMSLAM